MHFQVRGKREEERGLHEVVRLRSGTWVTDCKLDFWGSGKNGTLFEKNFFKFEWL